MPRSGIVILFLVMLFAKPVYAASAINVIVNDVPLESDAPALVVNGRTMVPMRAIFEALSAEVDWNADTKTIKASKDDIVITLTVGNKYLIKNRERLELDTPVCIIDGRTMVPVRAVAESLDCKVQWDANEAAVVIVSNNVLERVYIPEPIDTENIYTDYLSRFAFLKSGSYYADIVKWFLASRGVFFGFAFIIILFMCVRQNYDGHMARLGEMIKIIALLSFVCSFSPTITNVYKMLGIAQPLQMPVFNEPHNLAAGVILTFVLMSFYDEWRLADSVFFGLAVYLAVPFLGHMDITRFSLWVIVWSSVKVLLFAVVCPFIVNKEHYYEGWTLYFIFYMAAKLISHFMAYTMRTSFTEMYTRFGTSIKEFVSSFFSRTLASYFVDIWVFVLILVILVVLEKWMTEEFI